jgi:hypothetical protein
MPLACQVIAEEYVAGVETPRFAIASHHFTFARQDYHNI